MDDRGNIYEDPTEDQIRELNLVRLPLLRDRFADEPAQATPALSRKERRAQERQLAKNR